MKLCRHLFVLAGNIYILGDAAFDTDRGDLSFRCPEPAEMSGLGDRVRWEVAGQKRHRDPGRPIVHNPEPGAGTR
jgi:hypothetical protein